MIDMKNKYLKKLTKLSEAVKNSISLHTDKSDRDFLIDAEAGIKEAIKLHSGSEIVNIHRVEDNTLMNQFKCESNAYFSSLSEEA